MQIKTHAYADIKYLKSTMPSSVDQRFFEYLKDLTPKDVTIYAMEEGSVAFPRLVKTYWTAYALCQYYSAMLIIIIRASSFRKAFSCS